MHSFRHSAIPIPSFHGLRKKRLGPWHPFSVHTYPFFNTIWFKAQSLWGRVKIITNWQNYIKNKNNITYIKTLKLYSKILTKKKRRKKHAHKGKKKEERKKKKGNTYSLRVSQLKQARLTSQFLPSTAGKLILKIKLFSYLILLVNSLLQCFRAFYQVYKGAHCISPQFILKSKECWLYLSLEAGDFTLAVNQKRAFRNILSTANILTRHIKQNKRDIQQECIEI